MRKRPPNWTQFSNDISELPQKVRNHIYAENAPTPKKYRKRIIAIRAERAQREAKKKGK